MLNLPLRQPPVMLARAAASVDLLSGARFELGIGAGRVCDQIEAMGGPRHTPGEAVEALQEATAVIREDWAADKPGPVFFDGALPGLGRGAQTRAGRGLFDGPPAQWAEELADMALRYGVGTFVLAADEAATIERFAAEVVPRTRELIAAERQAAATG